MASQLVKELINSGIHYGHRASRWNPRMKPYILAKRNTIHIVDIRETVKGLLRAKKFITRTVAQGGDVLFVGTKRQAKPHIVAFANEVKMPYVAERWLGGTLTNYRTIRSRLGRLEELEKAEADGTLQEYSKKMIAAQTRELRKIQRNLGGIRDMNKLPKVLVVVDVEREHNAVREARKLHIPTVCLIDTDSNPNMADVPIPGNDDSMRAIELVLRHLTESIKEGLKGRTVAKDDGEDRQRPRRRSSRSLARADDDASAAPLDHRTTSEADRVAAKAVESGADTPAPAGDPPAPSGDAAPPAG